MPNALLWPQSLIAVTNRVCDWRVFHFLLHRGLASPATSTRGLASPATSTRGSPWSSLPRIPRLWSVLAPSQARVSAMFLRSQPTRCVSLRRHHLLLRGRWSEPWLLKPYTTWSCARSRWALCLPRASPPSPWLSSICELPPWYSRSKLLFFAICLLHRVPAVVVAVGIVVTFSF